MTAKEVNGVCGAGVLRDDVGSGASNATLSATPFNMLNILIPLCFFQYAPHTPPVFLFGERRIARQTDNL